MAAATIRDFRQSEYFPMTCRYAWCSVYLFNTCGAALLLLLTIQIASQLCDVDMLFLHCTRCSCDMFAGGRCVNCGAPNPRPILTAMAEAWPRDRLWPVLACAIPAWTMCFVVRLRIKRVQCGEEDKSYYGFPVSVDAKDSTEAESDALE